MCCCDRSEKTVRFSCTNKERQRVTREHNVPSAEATRDNKGISRMNERRIIVGEMDR